MRCAKCGKVWEPVAKVDAARPVPVEETPTPAPRLPPTLPEPVVASTIPPLDQPESVPEAAPAPATPTRPARRGNVLVALAWVASLAVLGAAGYVAVTYRAAVMQAWPPSIRAYAALGLLRQ